MMRAGATTQRHWDCECDENYRHDAWAGDVMCADCGCIAGGGDAELEDGYVFMRSDPFRDFELEDRRNE